MKRIINVMGQMLVGLVILIAVPSSVPHFFGIEIFNIVSGSMEPGIPVGSVAYVAPMDPASLEEGDVIAFESKGAVILHRVVENDYAKNQLSTKGDANAASDLNPVAYNDVVGGLVFSLPFLGSILTVATSLKGKVYLFCFLTAGVILCFATGETPQKPARNKPIWDKLFVVSLSLFLMAFVVLADTWIGYFKEQNVDKSLAKTVVGEPMEITAENPGGCPISVDFDALKEINPEIVAWIYCEDTVINYPICATDNDDYYLHHAFDGSEKKSGTLFLEMADKPDFSDTNSVIYGHHMKDGSMFSCLQKWGKQDFYDDHKTMWFLTPEATYELVLFSGYTTSYDSDTYTVFRDFGDITKQYITSVYKHSNFKCDVPLEEILVEDDVNQKYLVLSTCAYNFENARYVLHGKLVEK